MMMIFKVLLISLSTLNVQVEVSGKIFHKVQLIKSEYFDDNARNSDALCEQIQDKTAASLKTNYNANRGLPDSSVELDDSKLGNSLHFKSKIHSEGNHISFDDGDRQDLTESKRKETAEREQSDGRFKRNVPAERDENNGEKQEAFNTNKKRNFIGKHCVNYFNPIRPKTSNEIAAVKSDNSEIDIGYRHQSGRKASVPLAAAYDQGRRMFAPQEQYVNQDTVRGEYVNQDTVRDVNNLVQRNPVHQHMENQYSNQSPAQNSVSYNAPQELPDRSENQPRMQDQSGLVQEQTNGPNGPNIQAQNPNGNIQGQNIESLQGLKPHQGSNIQSFQRPIIQFPQAQKNHYLHAPSRSLRSSLQSDQANSLPEAPPMQYELKQSDTTDNPYVVKLYEKQRQIDNLRQLLLQVESRFQMEVNEVGRLQQSVTDAERDLDDAVRLMQEVKMKNIKAMQHIEAAQDAAGRNLESKALKAHAEETQLAMHDRILFSERQRLNALRAQMTYLQTELASAPQTSGMSFPDIAQHSRLVESNLVGHAFLEGNFLQPSCIVTLRPKSPVASNALKYDGRGVGLSPPKGRIVMQGDNIPNRPFKI